MDINIEALKNNYNATILEVGNENMELALIGDFENHITITETALEKLLEDHLRQSSLIPIGFVSSDNEFFFLPDPSTISMPIEDLIKSIGKSGSLVYPANQTNVEIIKCLKDLTQASKAVVARWDSPLWKDQPHTADYIHALRTAIDNVPEELKAFLV